jgi:hypothetical protein
LSAREASKTGVYAPDRLPDVIAFFRAISADEKNATIVIEEAAEASARAGGHSAAPRTQNLRAANAEPPRAFAPEPAPVRPQIRMKIPRR